MNGSTLWLFLATYKAAAAVIKWKSVFYMIQRILQIWLWRVLQSIARYILLKHPPDTNSESQRWTPTSLKITIDAPAVPLDYTARSIDSEDPTFRAILEVSPMPMAHKDWVYRWGKLCDKKNKTINLQATHKLYRINIQYIPFYRLCFLLWCIWSLCIWICFFCKLFDFIPSRYVKGLLVITAQQVWIEWEKNIHCVERFGWLV